MTDDGFRKPQLLRPSPHRVTIASPAIYRPEVLALAENITDIPGVRFDGRTMTIEFPHTVWGFQDVRDFFTMHQLAVPSPAINRFENLWQSTTRPLFQHQLDGAEFLVERGGGLLADAVGVGKTATAICAAETYISQCARNKYAPRVVIGPKFLRKVWESEHRKINAPGPFTMLEGRDVSKSFKTDALWFYVHYDIVEMWWSQLHVLRPAVVIVDEAHMIKNTKTARYKGAEMAMSPAPLRLALTGTPIPNKISESHALLNLACGKWSWGNRSEYRKRYAGAYEYEHGLVDGTPSNMPEFHGRLSACYIRRTPEEVGLDLPMIMRETVECELDDYDNKAISHELRGYSAAQIVDGLHNSRLGSNTIEWTTRLRKVTSLVKVDHTIRQLQSYIEQEESVVVFTWLKQTAEELCTKLSGLGHSALMVTGDYKLEDREAAVGYFQNRGGIIIATYDSLGVGVTLTKARIVILHDLEWVPAKMIQAEGRIRRIGQTRGCVTKIMVAPGTLDERLAEVFIEKADIIAAALGDTDPLSFADLLRASQPTESVEDQVALMLKSWSN